MRILKRGITVSHSPEATARPIVGPVIAALPTAESYARVVDVAAVVQQVGDQTLVMPATSHGLARPPRRLPYTNRPPVPIPAPDAVVAPVPVNEQPAVVGPAPAALAVQTPALRLQQASLSAWERIERIDRYRLLRGLKLRMRVIVTVCDSERHTYANWPSATATIEVGEAGQPGIENGKDLVWAIDELVEAVGRVGPERVARVLRDVRPAPVVSVIPASERADDERVRA